MKHLGISGGGTKIAGLLGAAEVIMREKEYSPDIISGISAGSILSLPLAIGKFDQLRELILNLEHKTFFSKSPVKKDGSIKSLNALVKIIAGKHYLGKQGNLENELRKLVSREEFKTYQRNNNSPNCIVGAVDFYTGSRLYVNLKEVTYEMFPQIVNASSSIPIFTPGISFSKSITDFEGKETSDRLTLFDGGVRDHSPTYRILSSDFFQGGTKITASGSIYSRPEDNEVLHSEWKPKNLLKILMQHIDITNTEISKGDELLEKDFFLHNQVFDHGRIFLPNILKNVYDVDHERLRKLYEAGKTMARNNWISIPVT